MVELQSRRRFIRGLASLCSTLWISTLGAGKALALTSSSSLAKIKGLVIRRGERNYPLWRSSMSWYIFKPQRYPELIIRASSEADVVAGIEHARETSRKVVVRSTGHNPARAVLRDDSVLIDLSRLREVEIDAAEKTAWIQPGIKAEELLHLTTREGLAFPAAHTGIVGLGGYLLGGGIGWNMPEYGIACRSVLAAEVITAAGESLQVSASEHADLLWALRGAGTGFFAAATRYKLQLYPMHRAILLNRYMFPVQSMSKLLRLFEEIGSESGQRLETFIKVGHFFPVDKPYPERELVITVGFFAFGDSQEEAERIMLPVSKRRLAELAVLSRENLPITYADLYRPPETDYSSPNRTIVSNMWTDEPGLGLSMLAEKMQKDPPRSPRSFLLGGWSFNNSTHDPGSCVHTAGRHYLSWYMIAETEKDNADNYRWMDESHELVDTWAKSRYINEIDTLRYPQMARDCFTPQGWDRLATLRSKYDPGDVFHSFPGHT